MKEEKLLHAFSLVDDCYLDLMDSMAKEAKTMKISRKKLTKKLLIAAAVTVLLVTAVAAGAVINGPDQAWETTRQEIAAMQELGILSPAVTLSEEAERIFALPSTTGDDYWFGRIFKHRYNIGSSTDTHYMNLDVDTATGKITRLSIEAYADENDIPTGETITDYEGRVWDLYNNYDDIFPADITVDELCSRLAAYWGFTGYTLSGTQDDFYDLDIPAPDGSMKMMDVPEGVYLTVYFEGDQPGAPMYIEKEQFPGRVYFTLGTNHLVG